jgi:hypothetical protein
MGSQSPRDSSALSLVNMWTLFSPAVQGKRRMSFQAVTWAIEQKAGGPSAKATLWSIANYANEHWCAWPSQATIARDSEQSIDSVYRRVLELNALGLVRRVPLRHEGRKAPDFFILRRSPFFDAEIARILPLLPRRHSVRLESPQPHNVASSQYDNASTCGNAMPRTIPQPAANNAATCGDKKTTQEPVKGGGARAREELPFDLTWELAIIAGITDDQAWPPAWQSAVYRVAAFLRDGYTADDLRAGARAAMASKHDGPPYSIEYFARQWAKARGRREAPVLPNLPPDHSSAARAPRPGSREDRQEQTANARRELREYVLRLNADGERGGSEADGPIPGGLCLPNSA